MWVLLMIIFNQPYTVDHINNLGQYPNKSVCIKEQQRALKAYDSRRNGTASFGCIKVKPGRNI